MQIEKMAEIPNISHQGNDFLKLQKSIDKKILIFVWNFNKLIVSNICTYNYLLLFCHVLLISNCFSVNMQKYNVINKLVTIPSAKPTLFLFRTAMVMIHGQGKLGAKITS